MPTFFILHILQEEPELNNEYFHQLKNQNILIAGVCGFIGSEVTKQLSEIGAKVTILDNLSSGKKEYVQNLPNVTIIEGNITDEKKLSQAVKNIEFIINMIALPFIPDSYLHPMQFFDVNVNGTISLALRAIKAKTVKRFVHISSSEIYGTAQYNPMDENHPTLPHSTYAVSKLAGERAIYTMNKEHDLHAVIIRPFNSFGPNITQPYIIPEIIKQMLSNNDEIILGNVDSKRDFTYVSDTAQAIILSLVKDGIEGEAINVGSERSFSIKEIVNMIANIMSKKIKLKTDSSRFRPYDVDHLICDYRKARKLLGWKPEVSIEDGLKKTVEWAKQNGVHLKSPFKGWPSTYRENYHNN